MVLALVFSDPLDSTLGEPVSAPRAGFSTEGPLFYRKNAFEMKPQSVGARLHLYGGACFRSRRRSLALYLMLCYSLFPLPWNDAVGEGGFGVLGTYGVRVHHIRKGQMNGGTAPHLTQGSEATSLPDDLEDGSVSLPESEEKSRSPFHAIAGNGPPKRQELQTRISEPLEDQTVETVHNYQPPAVVLSGRLLALRDQANAFGEQLQRQAASVDSVKDSAGSLHSSSVQGMQQSHPSLNVEPSNPTSMEESSHDPSQRGERLTLAGKQLDSASVITTAAGKGDGKPHATRQGDQFFDHPYYPGLSGLLWKYQFILIIGALVAVFILQMAIDFAARKRLQPFSRISTCLMLGANFRDLGETKIVLFARFLTCTFLHLHVVHLFCNILCMFQSWIYLVQVTDIDNCGWWIYHWTFTLFMLSAFAGSFYSYHTTLKTTGFSIGASGGCLGLSLALLTFAVLYEGFFKCRMMCLLYLFLIIVFAWAPWERLASKDGSQKTDTGAHLGGLICGAVSAVLLWSLHRGEVLSGYTLMRIADIASIILLGLLVLAYLEVAKEHIIDGRELLVRAYVKWLHMDEQCLLGPDGRRHTDPGRLNCERLTEAFLYLLENEMIEDDPDTVIARLHEEAGMRCKSLPELGGCAA